VSSQGILLLPPLAFLKLSDILVESDAAGLISIHLYIRRFLLVTFAPSGELPAVLDAHLHMTHYRECTFPDTWYYFTNAATPDEWQLIDQITSEKVFPFYGIHPECGPGPIDDLGWENKLKSLNEMAQEKAVGIGECGIDKRYYDTFSKHEQIELCRRQIETAKQLKRPLSLHQVHASDTLFALIRELNPQIPWIMHGFFGYPEMAREILDLGGYISVGPDLLRSAKRAAMTLSYIPSDRLLLETDWPYTYTPPDWDTSSYAALLFRWYQEAAALRSIDIDRMIDIVLSNGKIFTDFKTHW
jgi:TatD DNase family protein